jgi:hypothetical protein
MLQGGEPIRRHAEGIQRAIAPPSKQRGNELKL